MFSWASTFLGRSLMAVTMAKVAMGTMDTIEAVIAVRIIIDDVIT
jgi:hypothetical protein